MKFIKALYLGTPFFWATGGFIFLFIIGQYFPFVYAVSKVGLLLFIGVFIIDGVLIFLPKEGVAGRREVADRLSNGDHNPIQISLQNNYPFLIRLKVIDEIPFQFQVRDFLLSYRLKEKEGKTYQYTLRPVKRGEYSFGVLNVYVGSILGLVVRRYRFDNDKNVKVYPSFLQMRKYELLAISNRLTEAGIKKIRRISNNNEFEQIRDYVQGDDIRTINWKATARRSSLMVNQYQDEKSQEVYSLIDMGRTMKMPFEEMTLVDYSINASLVISNIAMYKQDKAGIMTYSKQVHSFLPAERKKFQMMKIMDVLYNQDTGFEEADYEKVYAHLGRNVKKRSLLLLYTNFEGMSSLQRQLSTFRAIARNHLLVVIFFKNTEIRQILEEKPNNLEGIYVKTIAEKFEYEKRQIVKELHKHGVHSILTAPKDLNVNVINKYMELKAMGLF